MATVLEWGRNHIGRNALRSSFPPRVENVFHAQAPPPPVALKRENLTEALLN